jgi:hypothetical protein
MSCLNIWRQLMSEKTEPKILWTGAKPWPGSPMVDFTQHCPHGQWISTDIEASENDIKKDIPSLPSNSSSMAITKEGGNIAKIYKEDADVQIVSDLETIDQTTNLKFDGIFCTATLEHVKHPWVALKAMFNVMKEDGLLFIDTHHTFPIHGYPHDYFRFSTEALKSMAIDAGFKVLLKEYQFPCKIIPPREVTRWNTVAESYLNTNICAHREPDN